MVICTDWFEIFNYRTFAGTWRSNTKKDDKTGVQ